MASSKVVFLLAHFNRLLSFIGLCIVEIARTEGFLLLPVTPSCQKVNSFLILNNGHLRPDLASHRYTALSHFPFFKITSQQARILIISKEYEIFLCYFKLFIKLRLATGDVKAL